MHEFRAVCDVAVMGNTVPMGVSLQLLSRLTS